MLAVALSFGGCKEGTDFDIEYTPIAPIGGQYDIIIFEGYDENKTDAEFWATATPDDYEQICEYGDIYAYLSNTTDYDKDKAWLRVGGRTSKSSYNINAKISIDMTSSSSAVFLAFLAYSWIDLLFVPMYLAICLS